MRRKPVPLRRYAGPSKVCPHGRRSWTWVADANITMTTNCGLVAGYGVAVSGSRDAPVTVYYDLDLGLFVGGEYFSVALGLDCKVGVVPEGGLAGCDASWIQMVDGGGATEGGDTQ